MRRMLNVRVLSEPIPFQRGRSHNAYISESVSIHHRWSYLFEATLPVLRRMHREDGDCLVCESPRGHAIAIPVWMTDGPSGLCCEFSVGPPAVSLPALRALRPCAYGHRHSAQTPGVFRHRVSQREECDRDCPAARQGAELLGRAFLGLGAMLFPRLDLNWNRSANTSASSKARMEPTDSFELIP